MEDLRRDDLVSTTAIVAGAVAGVLATVLSLWLSSDDSAVLPPPSVEELLVAPQGQVPDCTDVAAVLAEVESTARGATGEGSVPPVFVARAEAAACEDAPVE